ncbi:MAG: 1-acyl-sn-glycerol-3-phosphate acyltransferase [Clostridia bacterium]|nr:1-acyl-sn-glycerol-3-phosphate acyltransferase [Clostridia bacterium]
MNVYQFLYKTLRRVISGPLYRVKVTGTENIPKNGPVILCSNHTAMMDVLVLISSTPRQIRFMAKKEAFSMPFLGKLIATCGAFPVDRAGMDVGAIKKAISILSEGEIMGIFPQGTRCPRVHPKETYEKLHGGVAMIAVRSKATILPVCIETEGHKLKLFHKTRVRFGKPIPFEEYTKDGATKEQYGKITEQAFDRVCALYEESRKENGVK